MRSTFKVLFYVNGSKEKNGIVPIMGRVTINGSVAQFSCKCSIPKELWDAKGNRAKGKSKEARGINLSLDNIKAQIIKHYQRLSDREAYVTADMVRNAYQGIGTEYETILGAFDKENAKFLKRVGKDRCMGSYRVMVETCRQRPLHGVLPCDGAFKELCGGVHQVVLQAQRHVHVGTYPRLHQGVLRIPHNGARVEERFRVAGLHVGQDGRFTGALQRSDTEKSVCSVPYHAQREGKGVSYGGRNPAAYRA